MTSREADLRGYRLELYRDPDDGSWAAEVPDLPGCVAAGESPSEAVDRAEDAIAVWIEAAIADGVAVPPPTPVVDEYSGRFVLRVTKGLHRQLVRQAKREGVSLNTYCSTTLAQGVTAAQFAEVRRDVRPPLAAGAMQFVRARAPGEMYIAGGYRAATAAQSPKAHTRWAQVREAVEPPLRVTAVRPT